jgi:serine/threonine protein kinase
MTAPAPQRLGRYRIVAEIGRGAMGVVYRGEDSMLERAVAVKTVLMSFAAEDHEGYLARFRQEARAMGALNHPAIISVYDYGNEGDIAYMAMELLEGRELRDVLSQSRLPLARALDIAALVAEGLAFAHARGVVHRDIKPGNIMVLDDGRAKIMDFGIARVRASDVKTQTGMMMGSPKYMSPEQILGEPADHRSDIFSLGVVLHEMLAGAPPFAGDDIPQLMYQVCNGRSGPPSRLNPEVPEVLDLVVAKALEKKPEDRYQDAGELAADLRRCAEALPRAGEPAAVAQRPVAAGTDAAVATQAQATIAAAAPGPAAAGLLPWRRFDSTHALERLARPQGADRSLLAPASQARHRWARVLRDRAVLQGAATLAAAAAIALAIAFG